ncbi:Uncharacterised protein [Paenibacillus thiaminolyticus]|nr:Uncharacterised protein [Paenibacillus thiaminolyticus]
MWIRWPKPVNLVIHKKRRCTGCGKGKELGRQGWRPFCSISPSFRAIGLFIANSGFAEMKAGDGPERVGE